MTDINDFDSEINNHEDLNNTIAISCEVLDNTIEDVKSNKFMQQTMDSTMDLVTNLMKEVECKEKAAGQAKEEAALSGVDILAKVDVLQLIKQRTKEANDKHARELYVQKMVLAAEMKELQLHVSGVLNERDKSLGILNEMRGALEGRLALALREKEFADKEKVKKEFYANLAFKYEEIQMEKAVQESERLKQEAVKISELQEFLIDRGNAVNMLRGDKCEQVKLLKELLELQVPLSELSSSVILPENEVASKTRDLDLKKQDGNKIGFEVDINYTPLAADIAELRAWFFPPKFILEPEGGEITRKKEQEQVCHKE